MVREQRFRPKFETHPFRHPPKMFLPSPSMILLMPRFGTVRKKWHVSPQDSSD